jgi:periplasmic protein TonB
MVVRIILLMIVLVTGAFALGDGFCPPTPSTASVPSKKSQPTPPNPDDKYAGTVTLLTVISDTGHVCGTRVLRGVGKQIDKDTEKAVRQWRFDPAKKDGHPVPVVVNIDVNYWRSSNGELISDPPPPNVKTRH